MRRSLIAMLVAVGTCLSLVLVASPAQAAWQCGDWCNKTDPATFRVVPPPDGGGDRGVCADDGRTVRSSTPGHGITLQLRYSGRCRTVWGRMYGGHDEYIYYIMLRYVYPSGETQHIWNGTREIPRGNPRPVTWGWQWNDAGVTIEACVSTSWSTDHILGACTGAY